MPPDVATTNFTGLDWVIVAIYIVFSVAIGFLVRRYVTNMTDFVVAGRTISKWLGVATVIGTEIGLVTVMYAAEMGYRAGFSAFHIPVVLAAMALLVGATGLGIVPLRRMGVLTIPEFYGRRFGPNTRALGATILVLAGVMNMGLFLKAGATFVANVTGLQHEAHIKWIMTVMLALVLAYTMLGGMLSVVLTDYVQFIMLSIGIFVCTGFALRATGWSSLVSAVMQHKGPGGINPLVSESFGITYILFMCFVGMAGVMTWQPNVVRACAARDTRTARWMFVGGSLGFLIRQLIPALWGICAFAYIAGNPAMAAAFAQGGSKTSMDAMPFFMARILPTGVLGIAMSAMLAAFMSTHDSYLLAWSSVIVQDMVAPMFPHGLSERARIWCTRVGILAIGVFLLLFGLWYPLAGQALWNYMAITGAIYFAGATVVIIAGAYWRHASSAGAVAAIVAGTGSVLALAPVRSAVLPSLGRLLGLGASEIARLESHLTEANITLSCTVLAVIAMVVFSILIPDARDGSSEGPS